MMGMGLDRKQLLQMARAGTKTKGCGMGNGVPGRWKQFCKASSALLIITDWQTKEEEQITAQKPGKKQQKATTKHPVECAKR